MTVTDRRRLRKPAGGTITGQAAVWHARPPGFTRASNTDGTLSGWLCGILSFVDVRQSTGSQGGATIDLTADELRALFNILTFAASGGVTAERPEREMAARLRAGLETALRG